MMKKKKLAFVICMLLTICVFCGCGSGNTNITDRDAYRQYGINCMNSGDYKGAIDAFQKALDQSRGKITNVELDICYYKAEAQYLNGNYEDAITTYSAIIDYNHDPQSYYLRGCLYFQMGKQQEAVNDFGMAFYNDKSDYELCIGIYETMAAQQMESEGQYYLNQALENKSDKAYDLMEKGKIYLLLSDAKSAVENLKKAVDKGNAEANLYLAQAYEEQKDQASADAAFQAYLDAGIATSYDLCDMAEKRIKTGDYEHAVTYLNSALKMEEIPNEANIYKNLAIAYEKQYDFASARDALKKYCKLMPDDKDAAREFVFLQSR